MISLGGFVALDGFAIYAVGDTEAGTFAKVNERIESSRANHELMEHDYLYRLEQIEVIPATTGLVDLVNSGSYHSWNFIDHIACTQEEHDECIKKFGRDYFLD